MSRTTEHFFFGGGGLISDLKWGDGEAEGTVLIASYFFGIIAPQAPSSRCVVQGRGPNCANLVLRL